MRQSTPSSSIDSCAGVSDTAPESACGRTKRPRSSLLANRHRPWPSYHSTLTRQRRRLAGPRRVVSGPGGCLGRGGVGRRCRRERCTLRRSWQRTAPGSGQTSGRRGARGRLRPCRSSLPCCARAAHSSQRRRRAVRPIATPESPVLSVPLAKSCSVCRGVECAQLDCAAERQVGRPNPCRDRDLVPCASSMRSVAADRRNQRSWTSPSSGASCRRPTDRSVST